MTVVLFILYIVAAEWLTHPRGGVRSRGRFGASANEQRRVDSKEPRVQSPDTTRATDILRTRVGMHQLHCLTTR
jgi:hypothetical protein